MVGSHFCLNKNDRVWSVWQDNDKNQNNGLIGHNCGVLLFSNPIILLGSIGDCFYNKNLLRSSKKIIFNVQNEIIVVVIYLLS